MKDNYLWKYPEDMVKPISQFQFKKKRNSKGLANKCHLKLYRLMVKKNPDLYGKNIIKKKYVIQYYMNYEDVPVASLFSLKTINERIIFIYEFIFKDIPDKPGTKASKSDEFLRSYKWRKLRYKVLSKYGSRCMCCGQTPDDGIKIHVDHIKPRSKYPELSLDINNLQILCNLCNHGKSNWDETDFRNEEDNEKILLDLDEDQQSHLNSIMAEV